MNDVMLLPHCMRFCGGPVTPFQLIYELTSLLRILLSQIIYEINHIRRAGDK